MNPFPLKKTNKNYFLIVGAHAVALQSKREAQFHSFYANTCF